MANPEHTEVVRGGATALAQWRSLNPAVRLDLAGADLRGADLREARLIEACLRGANLRKADLTLAGLVEADLRSADLRSARLAGADLTWANLMSADLRKADLSRAVLRSACLVRSNFAEANLEGVDLRFANLVETNLERAVLKECSVYGISAWNVRLHGAVQTQLAIGSADELRITTDNLEVAQFIHLLLNNKKVRSVIDTVTSKVVLILGRFTAPRKAILDGIREELRRHDYLPVLFDFDGPGSRDLTETITTLAHLARFILADITDARSIPQELAMVVPNLPSVPVQPLLEGASEEYAMFDFFKRFPWVLELHRYADLADLLAALPEKVIAPAEARARELRKLP
jgi:uncharacterized protein YjbI with pentapeptide repeats